MCPRGQGRPRGLHLWKEWLSVIPTDNTPDTKDTVVCERPNDYETVIHYAKQRLLNPPSLFSCDKPSLLPTSVPPLEKPFDLRQKCGANWLMS